MRWNDLSIVKKLSIGFGFIGLLLIIISTVSGLGFKNLSKEIDHNIYMSNLAEELLEREIDHIIWQNKVILFLADEHATTLIVKTDHNACKLGKWLYGDERKQAETLLPAIAPMLKRLESPHKNLHLSALEIQKAATENDGFKDTAMVIYNTKTRKAKVVFYFQSLFQYYQLLRNYWGYLEFE